MNWKIIWDAIYFDNEKCRRDNTALRNSCFLIVLVWVCNRTENFRSLGKFLMKLARWPLRCIFCKSCWMPRAGSSMRLVRLKPQGPGPKRARTARYNEHFPPLLAPKFLEKKISVFSNNLSISLFQWRCALKILETLTRAKAAQYIKGPAVAFKPQGPGPGVTVIRPCWQ